MKRSSQKSNSSHRTDENKLKGKSESFKVRLPQDYPWKVLAALHADLRQFIKEDDSEVLDLVIRTKDLDTLMFISDDWGLQSMSTSDASLAEKRAKYQLASLLKKFRFPGSDAMRKSAALDKFYAAETTCRTYNLKGYKALTHGRDPLVTEAYTYALAWVRKVIGDSPMLEEMDWCRHGPGASLDTSNGLVSQYHKFENWPYSVTARAFRQGVRFIETDDRWYGALEEDYRGVHDVHPISILDRDIFWRSIFRKVIANKITTVPKSYKTDRTIAIEPTMNLFLQLGVDGFIRKRLKRWDIDLDDQSKNQELARLGSISGGFATIDLAAASDSISLKLCESILPPSWYDYLLDLRSPYGDVDGELLKYEKISSMGNGYTFALESLLFGALVYGVLKTLRCKTSLRECAIYGDDLIVPTESVTLLIRVLNAAGFTLNHEKSFVSGPVRESCGADWYSGFLVRPVFFTSTPTLITELFCDFNRLKRILSLYWGIGEESSTLTLLKKWIPRQFLTVTGPLSDEEFDSYIHSETVKNAVFSRGYWKHKVIVSRPIKVKSQKLPFRKLMHYLRGRKRKIVDLIHHPYFSASFETKTTKGSQFDVGKRNAFQLTTTFSSAETWQQEYAAVPINKRIFT